MTAPTDQFVDIATRTQEAVTAAVRSWADTVQGLVGGQPKLPDAHAAVNKAFDFAEQILASQRAFAQTLVSTGVQAAEVITDQAARTTETVVEKAAEATRTGGDKAASTVRSAK